MYADSKSTRAMKSNNLLNFYKELLKLNKVEKKEIGKHHTALVLPQKRIFDEANNQNKKIMNKNIKNKSKNNKNDYDYENRIEKRSANKRRRFEE